MEYCLSSSFTINNRLLISSSSSPTRRRLIGSLRSPFAISGLSAEKRWRSAVVVAGASGYGGFVGGGGGCCEFSSLNTPIVPVTPAGRFLSSVVLNDRRSFHDAVAETLEKLVVGVDEANVRRALSADSSEGCLHRFSELKVHLIPPLSKCIYNNRLEILPSKDWELESIHSFEILEMIRAHLTSVIGWRSDFSVTDSWATTKVKRVNLFRIYTSSILLGYFLKSATLRHQLEMSLLDPTDNMIFNSYKCKRKNLFFSHAHNSIPSLLCFDGKKKREKLSSYLMGFAPDSLAKCAQPNSKEALNLITKQSVALFGDVESEQVISTSFATLKRFVLEAVAFGSFLWDAEQYVNTVYNLEEIN